eukprot:5781286-Pyramimonas_sp.AAC.1
MAIVDSAVIVTECEFQREPGEVTRCSGLGLKLRPASCRGNPFNLELALKTRFLFRRLVVRLHLVQ